MAKEFIARNGLVSKGTTTVSGSLITTQPASFSGSLDVSGSGNFTNGLTVTGTVNATGTTNFNTSGGNYVRFTGAVGGQITYGYASYFGSYYFAGWTSPGSTNSGLQSGATGRLFLGNGNNPDLMIYGNKLSIGSFSTPTAKLQIKGTGTTSSTTALLVEDANGSGSLQVRDDGAVLAKSLLVSDTAGAYRTALSGYDNNEIAFRGTRWSSANGGTATLNDSSLGLSGQSGGGVLTGNQAITISNTNGNAPADYITLKGTGQSNVYNGRSRNIVKIVMSKTIPSGSTNINYNSLSINPTLDYTNVGGSSIVRGLYYGPSITGLTGDHIAIQTVSGDVKFQGDTNVEITGSLDVTGSITAAGTITGQTLEAEDSLGRNVTISAGSNTTINWSNGSLDTQRGGVTISRLSGAGSVGYFVQKLNINVPNVITNLGAALGVRGSGTSSSTTALLVENSNGDDILKATDDRDVEFAGGEIKLNKYTAGGRSVEIDNGSHNGAIGIRVTSAIPISAQSELGVSGNNPYGASIYAQRPNTGNKNLGLLAQGAYISDTSANSYVTSAMLHVRGSGTDSTTTGLLIENSNGDTSVIVRDDAVVEITGSLIGQPVDITPTTATASLDCSQGNFFDLTLSASYELYLSASNLQAGQTMNLRITQPATSGSLTYGSEFKFPGGIPYEVSATGSTVDIVSFISFDSSTLYGTAIKNLS